MMRQVGLVMFYGIKPPHFSMLIAECQEWVHHILGDIFHPYGMDQVHATLVSLEEVHGFSELNLNFERYRGQHQRMDFHGLLDFIRTESSFPFQIQIGGFRDQDYPFVSQEQRPYKRSFSVIGDKVVVIGWPIRREALELYETNTPRSGQEEYGYPNTLEEIRRSLQRFNVLHTYHRADTDIDNDFYFRIGLAPHLLFDDPRREQVEQSLRQFLSVRKPVILDVTLSDVFIVSFDDNKLLPSSIQIWPISNRQVTPEFISQLYRGIS
jgi:hypothetical protein